MLVVMCLLAGGVARLGALLFTARLGVTLCSDMRFATAGTGGEAALPGVLPPKEASSCSRIFGFRPAGSSFLTALPTLACTCNRIPGMRSRLLNAHNAQKGLSHYPHFQRR